MAACEFEFLVGDLGAWAMYINPNPSKRDYAAA